MKSVLSSIDLVCVLRELALLEGSFLDRVYQVGDEFVFHFKKDKRKLILRVVIGKLIHLTSYIKENPETPSNFCMFLRKYLRSAKLLGITQPNLERIVVLRFGGPEGVFKVVFELFSSGNVIVTDEALVIKQCLKFQRFSAREVRPGVVYNFPPSLYDLGFNDFVSFNRVLKSTDKPDLVRVLAIEVGLGGDYAEEVCFNSGVDKSSKPGSLSDDSIRKCFDALSGLLMRAKRSVLAPRVIMDGERVVDVTPFALSVYEGKFFREFPMYNDALDFFYARSESNDFEDKKLKLLSDKRKTVQKRLDEAKAHVESLHKLISDSRLKAEVLSANSFMVESVLKSLLNARRSNVSWTVILERLVREKEAGSSEASIIKEVRPDSNIVVLDLLGGLEIPLNSVVSSLINGFFSEAKKLSAKLPGALDAIKRVEAELSKVTIDSVKVDAPKPKLIDVSSKEWFTRFKWFRTTDGELCISGRNAVQNEELINKYLEPDDLVFHADVHGSPFTLLRNGKRSSETSHFEAALFTGAHSSAWMVGGSVDVFYVNPDQVSKTPPSGEFLRTGGFIINGKKWYFKSLKPELALGVELLGELNYHLISGPVNVVKARCEFMVVLEPGGVAAGLITHEVVEYFKNKGFSVKFEDVRACLPSGESRIVSKV